MIPDLSNPPAVLEAMSLNNETRISCMIRQNPDMSVLRLGDTLYTNTNLSSRVLNIAMGGDFSRPESVDQARQIRQYYAERNLDFALWLGPLSRTLKQVNNNLEAAGYEKTEEVLVGMAAALVETVTTTSAFPLPTDLNIVQATTPAQLHDFGEVINSAFPPPPCEGYCDFADFFAKLATHIDFTSFPYRMFVGYVGDVPMASSATLLDAGIAGVFDVCTKPEFQRRGYAALMMRRVLDEAQGKGYKVTALLASKEGQGIYSRLGYQKLGEWHIWNNV